MSGRIIQEASVGRFPVTLCAAFVLAVSACASSGTRSSAGGSDFIPAEEIASSGATNAYEAVTRLRPTWLRMHGRASIANGNAYEQVIMVYLDGHRLGDVVSLRMLSTNNLVSMQWLDAARAATVLPGIGSEAIAGAIVIKSK